METGDGIWVQFQLIVLPAMEMAGRKMSCRNMHKLVPTPIYFLQPLQHRGAFWQGLFTRFLSKGQHDLFLQNPIASSALIACSY